MKLRTFLVNTGAVGLAGLANIMSAPASAHIDMVGALQSRGGDQKNFPCDGNRSSGPVYTFEPGATITLSLTESIPHPSYFRIAFDNEGDDNFVEPKSIDPKDVDPSRPCPYNADDQCGPGKDDYCNVVSATGGATVLWDNLDPHPSSLFDFGKMYSWKVTLPNVECENCTIQVLQIMEDVVHGAYCPQDSCKDTVEPYIEDIYHRCINIKLKRGAGGTAGVTTGPVQNKGINCLAGQVTTDAGVGSSDASVPQDAGAAGDAAATGGAAGGTAGGPAGGGTSGGQVGVAGGVGGVAGGAAGGTTGGTSTTGGAVTAGDASTGLGGGSATTGGTAGAGVAGGVAGGTTAGAPGYDEPSDDGCDCAVSDGSPRYGNLIGMGVLALALLVRRRRYTL